MKILCTFSGQLGDVLWSLPTVREISQREGMKVDFGTMPESRRLLPLLKGQLTIDRAFVIENWKSIGSPHGLQPWEAPLDTLDPYDKVYHLTYRHHPAGNQPLIDFIATQQGLTLTEPVCPFIDCRNFPPYNRTYIAYAFNEMYKDLKDQYIQTLSSKLGINSLNGEQIIFQDVSQTDFGMVKYLIKYALCFVGCRSSNWVIAHGVGQKNIIVYEPHPMRHNQGGFGTTFCNPHWKEITGPLVSNPELEAERAAHYIKQWVEEKRNICQ